MSVLSKLAKISLFDNFPPMKKMKRLIERKEYISNLVSYQEKGLIKVVTGLRRAGKSTLLELFKNRLIDSGVVPSRIHFYNFELPENYLDKTWNDIYFEIKSRLQAGETNFIFFDEIQNIAGFEKLTG